MAHINGGSPGNVVYSTLFGGSAFTITAAESEANAITNAKDVEHQWPRWQISYQWTAGSTKTATLLPIWQDASGNWKKLGAFPIKDSFAKGDIESQLSDIVAPAGAQKVGFGLADYTDGTVAVEVIGVR